VVGLSTQRSIGRSSPCEGGGCRFKSCWVDQMRLMLDRNGRRCSKPKVEGSNPSRRTLRGRWMLILDYG
jgi:hypothetical protein